MNTRIFSVIAILTLMTFSSGCSGVRNFLFGRGARCGSCNLIPRFGNTMQAPSPTSVPYVQTPQCPPCPTVQSQPCVTAPSHCGCSGYSAGHVCSEMPCGGGCECSTGVSGSYGPVYHDPYSSDQVIGDVRDGQIMGAPVISDQVVGGSVVGPQSYPTVPGTIAPDNFESRKFDRDGARILSEEPLPEGATAL